MSRERTVVSEERVLIDEDDVPDWPGVELDWSYQNEEDREEGEVDVDLVEQMTDERQTQPWESYHQQGRVELLLELRQAASGLIRAQHWASVVSNLPEGVERDIRSLSIKLQQVIQKLSDDS